MAQNGTGSNGRGSNGADPKGTGRNGSATPRARPALESRLHGELTCVGCRYSLKGLSIRSSCPECGLAVRATLLSMVDPKAPTLRPVCRPWLTAYGLIAWAVGACVATLSIWALRLEEMLMSLFAVPLSVPWATVIGTGGIALSGLGAACSLIKPHATTPSKDKLAAIGAVLAYVPVGLIFWQIHGRVDTISEVPYFGAGAVNPTRVALRMAMAVLIAVIIVGLRPNARVLSERSMVLRTGRVDRQSMLALLAALGVSALGDLVRVMTQESAGTVGDVIRIGDTALIGVGSLLFSVGLGGILIDTLRLRPVIQRKVVGLDDVLAPPAERDPNAPNPPSRSGAESHGTAADEPARGTP